VLTNLSKARSAEEKTKRFQIVLELGTAAFLLTRRPSLLQKRVVPEWVESAGQLKKGQVDIYSPQPLEETMRPLKKSAASKDRNKPSQIKPPNASDFTWPKTGVKLLQNGHY
jgi:hypothetical protein